MWNPHAGPPIDPTLLTSTLAPKGDPHAKLQPRSQGCSVAKSFALVLLGAALFFLTTEPVKSQSSSPRCGWGQLLLWMGNWHGWLCRATKETWLKQLEVRQATRREQEVNQPGGDRQWQRSGIWHEVAGIPKFFLVCWDGTSLARGCL